MQVAKAGRGIEGFAAMEHPAVVKHHHFAAFQFQRDAIRGVSGHLHKQTIRTVEMHHLLWVDIHDVGQVRVEADFRYGTTCIKRNDGLAGSDVCRLVLEAKRDRDG